MDTKKLGLRSRSLERQTYVNETKTDVSAKSKRKAPAGELSPGRNRDHYMSEPSTATSAAGHDFPKTKKRVTSFKSTSRTTEASTSVLGRMAGNEQDLGSSKFDTNSVTTSASARHTAHKRGFPFVFVNPGKKFLEGTQSKDFFATPLDYFQATFAKSLEDSAATINYVLSGDKKIYSFGHTSEVSEKSHALMGYAFKFGYLALVPDLNDKRELQKAAAIGYLAFKNGFMVKRSSAAANAFWGVIPEGERRNVFSNLMVEALYSRHTQLALLCLPQSNGIKSIDEDGNGALSCALNPESEEVLKLLLADTTEDDLHVLADLKKYALFSGWTKAAALLESRANEFMYTLDSK